MATGQCLSLHVYLSVMFFHNTYAIFGGFLLSVSQQYILVLVLTKYDQRRPNMLKYHFYARKQLLLSARLSHRNSVCPSICHMGGSVKNGLS